MNDKITMTRASRNHRVADLLAHRSPSSVADLPTPEELAAPYLAVACRWHYSNVGSEGPFARTPNLQFVFTCGCEVTVNIRHDADHCSWQLVPHMFEAHRNDEWVPYGARPASGIDAASLEERMVSLHAMEKRHAS